MYSCGFPGAPSADGSCTAEDAGLRATYMLSACGAAGNDPPGQANLAICSSAVGQRYKCLAFTLEMPFKDTSYANEPTQVGPASRAGAADCLLELRPLQIQSKLMCLHCISSA